MKRIIPPVVLLLLAVNSWAQNTLIHYWHFNEAANGTAQYYLPSIVPIHADYSVLDTAKAKIIYEPMSGVSGAYTTYYDYSQGDTINARLGHELDTPAYSLRLRNPSDSMETRFYLPTSGYKNVKLSFETEATNNGAKSQYFDYSVDSGSSWRTSGMSVLSTYFNSTNTIKDSITTSWSKIIISFDSTVNNTRKFVVRMKFGIPNIGVMGNDRFDNVALDGDSLNSTPPPPPPADTTALIHYWNFNLLDTAYHNPGIPAIYPDSTVLPHGQAKLIYALIQGAPANYSGYVDNVNGTALNNRYNTPPGQGLRVRNPTDSIVMFLYMPTTGYKNIRLSFATETSSLTHGQQQQRFQYSTDGFTYKSADMNVTSDTTQIDWTTVNINFGSDTAVNNNANLILMMTFAGNTADTAGNNRFDNIVVEGESINGVGVSSLNKDHECSIYPNPAGNNIYISTPVTGNKTISIYNITGQRVYVATQNGKLVNISVAQLHSGTYCVQVHDNTTGENYTARFVKQ